MQELALIFNFLILYVSVTLHPITVCGFQDTAKKITNSSVLLENEASISREKHLRNFLLHWAE